MKEDQRGFYRLDKRILGQMARQEEYKAAIFGGWLFVWRLYSWSKLALYGDSFVTEEVICQLTS